MLKETFLRERFSGERSRSSLHPSEARGATQILPQRPGEESETASSAASSERSELPLLILGPAKKGNSWVAGRQGEKRTGVPWLITVVEETPS